MSGSRLNRATSTGETLLELLHREQEGDLTPAERAILDEYQDDPEVQAARAALRRAVMLLSGPNPPIPRSIAAAVAAEVALSHELAAPALPRSVAASVVADLHTAKVLGQPPSLPASVAASVVTDLAAAKALQVPPMPRSVAASVISEISAAKQLAGLPQPRLPISVAASVAARIVQEGPLTQGSTNPVPVSPAPINVAPPSGQALGLQSSFTAPATVRNPAPLLLVGALLVGLTLLAVTTAWPNLAAGVIVLQSLLEQVSPLAGVGLVLLLLTSALITWKPTPALRTAGAGAFALSAVLTIPALFNVAGGENGLTIGRNVVVSGPVSGNIMTIGGNVTLRADANVEGEVVTLLGDVHREPGAEVGGRVNALLGHAPGDQEAIQTAPVNSLSLATAAAFRPVLGWLGSAAWPQIFVALTGGLLLLMFIGGVAPKLAHSQRHAPMRTLALGILLLAALVLPALGLTLVGFLGPALMMVALTALLIATGLSVSVYDAGRAFAYRMRMPVPDTVGALLGLSAFAASLSYAPLAFALALIGGAWGAGTLLLTQKNR